GRRAALAGWPAPRGPAGCRRARRHRPREAATRCRWGTWEEPEWSHPAAEDRRRGAGPAPTGGASPAAGGAPPPARPAPTLRPSAAAPRSRTAARGPAPAWPPPRTGAAAAESAC